MPEFDPQDLQSREENSYRRVDSPSPFDTAQAVVNPDGSLIGSGGGGGGTVNQGTPGLVTAPWFVELSNGTTEVGTSSAPLRVDPTGTTTQPVSASSLPLPTGASTSALQTTGNSSLTSILANQTNGTQETQVTNFPATQPVSGTVTVVQPTGSNLHADIDSSALPTGAATAANQTTANGSLASILANQTNGTQETQVTNFPATTTVVQPSGASLHVDVDNFPATQPVSGTVAVSNFPATQPVSGTVTSNQGAPNTTANAWPTEITDGTNKITLLSASQAPPTQRVPVLSVSRTFGQVLTSTPLGANAVYTSPWFDTNQTGTTGIKASVYTDQASAASGFIIQISQDTTNANFTQTPTTAQTTVVANTLSNLIYSTRTRYWRVVYTNGATPQTVFELATTELDSFSPVESNSNPTGTETAVLVRQIIPASLVTFQASITTSASQLASNASKSVALLADPLNTDNIFIGPAGVTTSTGFKVPPGYSVTLDITNSNAVYAISGSGTQTLDALVTN